MELDNSTKQEVVKNSFWNSLSVLINRIGAIIFIAILTRILLPEEFGIYNLAISIGLIFMTFSDLGINTTLIRYVSNASGEKEKQKASAYFRYIFKIKFWINFAVSFLLLAISYPLSVYVFKKPDLFLPLVFSSFYILIFSFESFFESFFYISSKVKYRGIKELVSQFLRIILIFLVFFLFASSFYLVGAIISLALTSLLVVALSLYYIKKIAPFIFKKSIYLVDKRRVLRFFSFLSIGAISSIFFSYIDALMIGILIPDASYVGYYKLAFAVVFSIGGLLSFTNVILPIFLKLSNQGLSEAVSKTIRYVSLLSIPAIFGVLALGRYFIYILSGSYEYLSATLPLYFLAFLIFEIATTAIFSAIYSIKEKPEILVKFVVLATILNIILNFVFIISFKRFSYAWATAGAAIATLLTRYILLIVLFFNSKKIFKMNIKNTRLPTILIASLVMFLALLGVNSLVNNMTIFIGILEIIFGFLVYAAIVLLSNVISFSDFRKMILAIINKK